MQGSDGVWSRSFKHGTVARWYPNASVGTVQWPGEPMPPAPAPPPPPAPPPMDPETCGVVLKDHTFSQADVGSRTASSAAACCQMCVEQNHQKHSKFLQCTQWAWHGATDQSCHMHSPASVLNHQKGTTAAYIPNRTATVAAVASVNAVSHATAAPAKKQCAYGTPNNGCPKGQYCQSGECACDCPSKPCDRPPVSGVCPAQCGGEITPGTRPGSDYASIKMNATGLYSMEES